MKSLYKPHFERARRVKQRGVVLFFALIALVAMSLAAVALIRSVDTSTLIAGNLAFKQAATSSGDSGIEAAIAWLAQTEAANSTLNVYMDPVHFFNTTSLADGYYSNVDPNLSLTDSSAPSHIKWDGTDSVCLAEDSSGNTTCYVIQRMCRDANQTIAVTSCLFSDVIMDNNNQTIRLPQQVCLGSGCPPSAQPPQIRITARTGGKRNTVSYVQAFVY
jgi:Tfp pilus assembly protein PilX